MSGPSAVLMKDLVGQLPTVTDIRWVDRITSTNRVLGTDDTVAAGTVLVADVQTEGRGRRGRDWHAPAGTSLMLSILLRPTLPRGSWSLLPLIAGTALVEACFSATALAPDRVALKWPNDLLLDGVKAAGILVESIGDRVVVGMGINTDWRDVERPTAVTATSLADTAGGDVDRWVLLRHLLIALDHHYQLAQRDPGGVVRRYVPYCATLGVDVTAYTTTPLQGTAVGLTSDGHLRIRTQHGREHVVTAGEVEHLR